MDKIEQHQISRFVVAGDGTANLDTSFVLRPDVEEVEAVISFIRARIRLGLPFSLVVNKAGTAYFYDA